MKNLESEKDALNKITTYLLEETLQPARSEAEKILEDAKKKAHEIISKAEVEQKKLIDQTKEKINNDQKSFYATLSQGLDQTIESLKQRILKDLFSPVLQQMVDQEMQKPAIIASLVDALVKAIQKEGLSLDLQAFIPSQVSVQDINKELSKEVLEKLQKQSVNLGKMNSGVEVKMVDKQVTIEMTGKALQEALMNYIRKELRELIFKNEP